MRGARLQCVKAMMKLIVVIFLVLAKITVIGFYLVFALWWLLFPFVEAPVKSGLSACGYSMTFKAKSLDSYLKSKGGSRNLMRRQLECILQLWLRCFCFATGMILAD